MTPSAKKKRDSDGDYIVSKDDGSGVDATMSGDTNIQVARNLCRRTTDNDVGAVVYDLLLDMLLYQPPSPKQCRQ